MDDNTNPDPERAAALRRVQQLPPTYADRGVVMLADVFIGVDARRALPQLVALCQQWQPDLIVREEMELAGAIAAEYLGLPHAAVQVTYSSYWHARAAGDPVIGQRLDELRTRWHLPPDPTLDMPHRHLYLSFDPPALLDPHLALPPTTQHLRADVFDRSSADTLPGWLGLPFARPLIYVTLGSEAARMPGVFPDVYQTILAGLRDVAGTVIMTVGRDRDPAALGPQLDHIRVERYVPQSLLLPHCDLVVTHGGHNTVLAALHHGLPMVCLPLFADQFDNATRSATLGVAQVIEPDDLTPDRINETINSMVHDRRYSKQARRLQSAIQTLPPLSHGVQLLGQLVAHHMPHDALA